MNTTAEKSCGVCARKKRGACKKCHAKKMAQLQAIAAAHVATGKCPDCGLPLKRNIALTGWWQCSAYACVDFRAPEFKAAKSCGFQCFTDGGAL